MLEPCTTFRIAAVASCLVTAGAGAAGPDRCIVPAALRAALLDEISGERALDHVQILAVNCDRQPADASRVHERYGAAHTKVTGAFNRARGGVESVLTIARDPAVTAGVQQLVSGLEVSRDLQLRKFESAYRERCRALGLQ
ncbi:MAG: hypothetical protein LC753_18830, partial [Acidobacteria bacterium]|nr:hypothetical protein [Acidobacteriota bacterium]